MKAGSGALGATLLVACIAAFFWWAVRRRGLARRPIPLGVAVLGVLPAIGVALGWAGWLQIPTVRWEAPWLGVPAGAVVLWIATRLLDLSPTLGSSRRMLIELCYGVAALGSAFAAVGLSVGLPLDRLTVVVVLDRSRSIDLVPNAGARIANELVAAEASMRDSDRIAIVAFASTASIEDPARPRTAPPSAQQADLARDGTDLGLAIQKALTAVPPDSAGRIVLMTDGVATRGNVERAALAATALGIPVDAVALDQEAIPNIRVASVRLSPNAAEGEALFFKIVTESSSEAAVELRVYRDGELVRKGSTRIAQGQDLISLRELATGPGLHRYDVELNALDRATDSALEDNSSSAFVRVLGHSRALVLEGRLELGRAMADALRSAAFDVQIAGLAEVPADLAEFGRYDLVVLGDISAADLAASQLEALAAYVRDAGGGLLLFGGERSLGPGGFGRTPVEEVSPVSFDLKQERRRASFSEVIAVDYSGSMSMQVGGRTKLELANEAAVRSAELLGAGDRLGVMHVDTELAWTVPLGPVSDKAGIAAKIRRVQPGGGGILIDLTLSGAYQALGHETVQLKHLLLFSDGSDAEEHTQAFASVARAKRRGITTSVVALGSGKDVPALARMAELGGGRFYLIHDATRLPAVFAQETVLASQSAIHELEFVPRVTRQSAILRGVDFREAPALKGYVVTLPKARAELHLEGPDGDPLLASWAAGIGRTAVFTSDYRDRWGVRWTSWDGAARLFAQLGRDLARRADDPRARLNAEATAGELALTANLTDDRGRPESFRRMRVRVVGPDGAPRDAELEAVGAGSYRARLALDRPGAYLATLVDEETGKALATTGAVLSAGEELRPTGSDRALLRRVAELSGGKLRENLAGIFNDREARRFGYTSLSAWLAALAACALVASVASRRLVLPRLAFLQRAETRQPLAPASTDPGPIKTLSVLQRRKQRTQAATSTQAVRSEEASFESPVQASPILPRADASSHGGTEALERGPHDEFRRSEPPSARSSEPTRPRSAAEILLERRRSRRQP